MTKKLDASIRQAKLSRCDSCFSDKEVHKVVLHSTGKSFCICNDCKKELGEMFIQ